MNDGNPAGLDRVRIMSGAEAAEGRLLVGCVIVEGKALIEPGQSALPASRVI